MSLLKFIIFLEDNGYNMAVGQLSDRVTIDGTFANVPNNLIDLYTTFPLQCLITRSIMSAAPFKTILFTGKFRTEMGNHLVRQLADEPEKPYTRWIPVDHFKFTNSAIAKLRAHTKTGDAYWVEESKKFLDFINKTNNIIDINNPKIHCKNFTPFNLTTTFNSRYDIDIIK